MDVRVILLFGIIFSKCFKTLDMFFVKLTKKRHTHQICVVESRHILDLDAVNLYFDAQNNYKCSKHKLRVKYRQNGPSNIKVLVNRLGRLNDVFIPGVRLGNT